MSIESNWVGKLSEKIHKGHKMIFPQTKKNTENSIKCEFETNNDAIRIVLEHNNSDIQKFLKCTYIMWSDEQSLSFLLYWWYFTDDTDDTDDYFFLLTLKVYEKRSDSQNDFKMVLECFF